MTQRQSVNDEQSVGPVAQERAPAAEAVRRSPALVVGAAGDAYEREADAAASEVIERLSRAGSVNRTPDPPATRLLEPAHAVEHGAARQVRREIDTGASFADAKKSLSGHIGAKARQQELVMGGKHGQGMAEDIALGNDGAGAGQGDAFGGGGSYKQGFKQKGHGQYQKGWKQTGEADPESEVSPEKMSKTLMDLVALTQFDDTASASVLELANKGTDLADRQMWNLILVNSKMMTYIQPGMKINKIIPDFQVRNVMTVGQTTMEWGSAIGGSVASAQNYEGLTGEEAISNFGLDYSGYGEGTTNWDGSKSAAGGALPQYVFKDGADKEGRTLNTVKNVFFINITLPQDAEKDAKVPVHPNVRNWALAKLANINEMLASPQLLEAAAQEAGATAQEMAAKLAEKLAVLQLFLERSAVEEGALTTLDAEGNKNKEDPLTNMGITKPSSRLQTQFGTINQEYFKKTYVKVPEGSGLWLKDSTGKDTQVATYALNPTFDPASKTELQYKWFVTDEMAKLINKRLQDNEDLRSGESWETN